MKKRITVLVLLTTMILVFTIVNSEPVKKNIQVITGGIKIVIDGKEITPKDANGNIVEPIIYDGTTYLPVRAIVNELTDKPVKWDQKTSTVLIGEEKKTGNLINLYDLEPYSGGKHRQYKQFGLYKDSSTILHVRSKQIIINDGYFAGQTIDEPSYSYKKERMSENVYLLEGNYTKMTGTIAISDSGNNDYSSSIHIWGDGELLYTNTMKKSYEPENFEISLIGVKELNIIMENLKQYTDLYSLETKIWGGNDLILYNTLLTGINFE